MTKIVNVSVAIIRNHKDEYLLTQRNSPHWPHVHLKWQLVGGKVDFGETTEETLMRECKEEIGQSVKIVLPTPSVRMHIWDHTGTLEHTILVGYMCELENEKITLNEESYSYKWFKFDEIKTLDYLPHTFEMIEELRNLSLKLEK